MHKKILVFDTETNGLVKKEERDLSKQPYIVQYAHALIDVGRKHWDVEETWNKLFQVPVNIPQRASEIHGIYKERLEGKLYIYSVMEDILQRMEAADIIAGHNIRFDMNMLYVEAQRIGEQARVVALKEKLVDTMTSSKDAVQAVNKRGHRKNPNLQEAYKHFYGEEFDGAHNALADVMATAKVLKALYKEKILSFTDSHGAEEPNKGGCTEIEVDIKRPGTKAEGLQ